MRSWWKEKVVYQIYPRSFQDSNNDGIGDIQGIINRLDILKELGIDIIWLSPVYESPNIDNGYDISNYRKINNIFGSMEDMQRLIFEANKRNIKIMMDLVINHTSNKHEWFEKSRKKIAPYKDYYIWRKGKNSKEPNNWTSFFAKKAWTYDDVREEYYLHLFAKEQPDLNCNNPKVITEVKDIMRFWLKKGICGFRCDVINIIYKNSLEDGKRSLILTGSEHYLTNEGTHRILKEIRRDVLDQFDCFTVGETVFVSLKEAKMLCEEERKELDMVFSFEHMEADQVIVKWFKKKFNSKKFFNTISKWQKNLSWNANYFENHDQLRSVSRFGDDEKYLSKSGKMLATLLLSLRGNPFIYQGQEIAMTNYDFKSMKDIEDVESKNVNNFLKQYHIPKLIRMKMINMSTRDNVRTPMQWDTTKNAGFTKNEPWLKVNSNYNKINVKNQMKDKDSVWNYYKKMIDLRKNNKVLIYGDFKEIKISKCIFIFKRTTNDKSVIGAFNFSKKRKKVRFTSRKAIISNYSKEKIEGILEPYEGILFEGKSDD